MLCGFPGALVESPPLPFNKILKILWSEKIKSDFNNVQKTPSIRFDTHISGLSSINYAFNVELVLVRLPCAGAGDTIEDNTRETVQLVVINRQASSLGRHFDFYFARENRCQVTGA